MANRTRSEGFTLVEALIVLAVLMIALLILMPALQNMMVRSKLEGVARETAQFIHFARLEAIKQSVPAVVRVDGASGEVSAFVDVDGPTSNDPPDGIYNPVAGDPPGQTDYQLGRSTIPYGVSQSAPSGQMAVDGLTAIGSERVVQILVDGSADSVGAYRFGDERGNFLEVRVEPRATARVTVRKWDGTAWWSRGEGGHPWQWD